MKFKIIDNYIEKREGYLLVITTMEGDADGYEDIEIGMFSKEQLHLLEEVINICDDMLNLYPRGKGGYEGYWNIEGFYKWFVEDSDEDISDIKDIAPFYWCEDDYECINSIEGYKVYYFKNGLKYEVEIEK